VRDLSDDQAREHPTVSALCLGGLVKHVSRVEERWSAFIVEGTAAMSFDPASLRERLAGFELAPGETLAEVLADYEAVAASTDELVATLPDLDRAQPLPEAPWFPPGTAWSARQVLLHIVAETAQHAGHADIIRESIDGAKTMG
jgi:uncharacterized damage-inducible protein DinB